MLEKANQLIRKAEELKAKMSETMRYRSDSVVSIDEPALQLGLNGEAVMEETVLEMLQTNNVEELRKIDADALALATNAKTYALHEACEAGSMDVVRFLLEEAEHDIDIRDAQQWTPLHYAAAFQGDKPELVHYLLSKGADAAHEDEDGDTALDAHLDESDADTVVAGLLTSVEEHDGYEHWARAHARAPHRAEGGPPLVLLGEDERVGPVAHLVRLPKPRRRLEGHDPAAHEVVQGVEGQHQE